MLWCVQAINEVATVDQVELLGLADFRLEMSIALESQQVLDILHQHLVLHHVDKPLRVVKCLNVTKDLAQFKSCAARTTSSIQS